MRIAFVGKGGSGKTALTALFSNYLASQNKNVFAIDADINQHLSSRAGVPEEIQKKIPRLDNKIQELKKHIIGTNPRIINESSITKTTPPGSGSRLISVNQNDPLLSTISYKHNNVMYSLTGDYTPEEVGVSCFHGKVGAVELLFTHLDDKKNDYIIADMTAGGDAFSSGLFAQFDLLFLIAESAPSSIDVYRQFKKFGEPYELSLKVIGNKVEDESDVQYLREHIGKDLFITIPRSNWIKALERGEKNVGPEKEITGALARMLKEAERIPHDRNALHKHAVEFHRQNAITWMSKRLGEDLTKQIDDSFSFETNPT